MWDVDDGEYTFDMALELLNAGEVGTAKEIMESLVTDDPTSDDAACAIRYLPLCYRALNLSFGDLFAYYRSIAENYADLEVASIARQMVPRVMVEERSFDQALESFQEIVDNPHNEEESLVAQISYLELEQVIESRNVDAVGGPQRNRVAVDGLMQRLTQIAANPSIADLPKTYQLEACYPNPFNAQTVIRYALPRDGEVKIQVFDLRGRLVETLASKVARAGYYRVTWDASSKSAGLYLIRMEAGKEIRTVKAILCK